MTCLRDRRGGGAAEAGLVLEHDGDRDLRVVRRREAMNHVVLRPLDARLGRARLAGDADAGDLRRGARAACDDAPPSSSLSSAAVCG